MALQLIGRRSYLNQVGSIDFPFVLNKRICVIDIDSSLKKDTWNKAGEALQIVRLDAFDCEVDKSYTSISFNPVLIKFPLAENQNYHIRFKPVPWLKSFTLSVYRIA